jgi:homoserine dehydrogenase
MGVARALLAGGALTERLGGRIRLKYVVDVRIDETRRDLAPPRGVVLTSDLAPPLSDPNVHVIVELIGGTDTAGDLIERALKAGKDVVTANKALLAEHGDRLYRLARRQGRSIAFGAAVGGGIPVVAAVRNGLIGDRIQSIYGILNGTCNYVLTCMLEQGMAYQDALDEAQRLGYAEADPSLDVDGHDTAHKLAVLARLAFGIDVRASQIPCEGIAGTDLRDMRIADTLGYRLKLMAVGVRRGERLELRVHPVLLRHGHAMAAVSGVHNAVCIHGDLVGELTLTGKGAGRPATASAVLADIARMALGTYRADFAGLSQFGEVPAARLVPADETLTRYYVRLSARDCADVFAGIAGILGRQGVGIASLHQQEGGESEGGFLTVVLITRPAGEGMVRRALEEINRLDVICAEKTALIRVEDI